MTHRTDPVDRLNVIGGTVVMIVACFCALMIAVMIAVSVDVYLNRNEPTACETKGGVDLLTRSGYVCIKKDSIIR